MSNARDEAFIRDMFPGVEFTEFEMKRAIKELRTVMDLNFEDEES